MAKEEEKEGRAIAKKDTHKRRSESNRKPDGSSNREDAKPKKKKMKYVVSLGHSSKISDRLVVLLFPTLRFVVCFHILCLFTIISLKQYIGIRDS
jgi:hypothetical protein